eukprot:CAMPEP_0183339506 /NCGR_PEP_ID=MMETSP0164_2-20130417/6405_1 /TAXON_ID=221442 /ORGANISM="Coccolithus pelagicus ssp braarudi, Strain PLY182g" /LENGTH=72 /DNA_ID=CAMNT_0025509505 /DNA_START=153 /DNA_END=367 /DNA_ORIENTATION=-
MKSATWCDSTCISAAHADRSAATVASCGLRLTPKKCESGPTVRTSSAASFPLSERTGARERSTCSMLTAACL